MASWLKLAGTQTGSWTLGINGVTLAKSTGQLAPYTLTLPTTAGLNGQVLATDGSGRLAWTSEAASAGKIIGNFTGPVTTQIGLNRYYVTSPVKITQVYASLGTATTSPVEIDVKVSGTTIFTGSRPTITPGQNLSSIIQSSTIMGSGQYATIDVLQAGGIDLVVYILYQGA